MLTLLPGRLVQFGLNASWRDEFGTSGKHVNLGPSVTIQLTNAIQLSLRPSATWNRDVSQYVTTAERADETNHYVMGDLTQRTASLTTRLQYIFSPNLSLQLYAQPLVSAGDYPRFWEVADPNAASFEERFRLLPRRTLPPRGGP